MIEVSAEDIKKLVRSKHHFYTRMTIQLGMHIVPLKSLTWRYIGRLLLNRPSTERREASPEDKRLGHDCGTAKGTRPGYPGGLARCEEQLRANQLLARCQGWILSTEGLFLYHLGDPFR